MGTWHGGKWIRKSKRARIHARDRWHCVWCEQSVYPHGMFAGSASARLAHLDHVQPRSLGGGNHHGNLVTACKACNDSRGARDALAFAGTFLDTAGVLARLVRAMGSALPK